MHKYGFDTYKDKLPPGTYSTVNAEGQTLHLPWKSVATGGSDRLLVTPTADSTLSFSYQGGMPLTGSTTAEGYHVWSGTPPAGEDNLLALCKADSAGNASVAGGVRVKAYDLKRHRVTVVPVGNSQPSFTKAELQTTLNSIYAQAVTEWEVTFEEPIDASGLAVTPEVNETDYSNDMRAIWRAYVGQRNNVPGTAYLFIIPGFADNSNMVGYMPLKSGYGFLTPKATTRDAAHELGHGVFNLRHTFSSGNVVNLPEGDTQNLMDYSTGSELFKYQWDYIHNPEGGRFLFEGSEEGAMITRQWDGKVKEVINKIKSSNINGIGYDFYLTFEDEEDFNFFGRNIVLGEKTYDYIRIDGPITPYDNNNRKTIVSNVYSKGISRNEIIPQSSKTVEVTPFSFSKFDRVYNNFIEADFEIFVISDEVEEFEKYISTVTGYIVDKEVMMRKAISVAASIPGVSAQCSNGLKHYVLDLVGDSILFSTKLGGRIPNEGQANDMYNFFEDNNKGVAGKKKFHEVTFQEATSLCQSGYLIITAYYNPNGSGHVNALLNEKVYSEYGWNWFLNGKDNDPFSPKPNYLPVVFDTGDNKRYPNPDGSYSNQKLTNAYGTDKHTYVKFYMYLDN